MPRLSMTLVGALFLGLMAVPAGAQQQGDLQKARQHYATAEKAMKSRDHALAAAEYGKAYEITRDPVLFYKIASAHYEARNCTDAVTYYERYITEGKPDEKFRALTEERIEECKAGNAGAAGQDGSNAVNGGDGGDAQSGDAQSGDTGRETRPDPAADDDSPADDDSGSSAVVPGLPGSGDAPPPSFVDSEVTWQSKAAWVSVGLAATFVTAGAVLGLSASSREEDLRNLIEFRYPDGSPALYAGNSRARYEDYIDEGERLAGYSKLALGAAGLAAVSATVFFILDSRSGKVDATETSAAVAPLATPEALGMSAGWRF